MPQCCCPRRIGGHAPAHFLRCGLSLVCDVLERQYPNFKPHRSLSVSSEFGLYIKRLLTMPYNRIHRRIATSRIAWGGFPYHLVLLQLEHDASFQIHSRFGTMAEFLEEIVENFAKSAPKHHHLVFKSHPLEDGRAKFENR